MKTVISEQINVQIQGIQTTFNDVTAGLVDNISQVDDRIEKSIADVKNSVGQDFDSIRDRLGDLQTEVHKEMGNIRTEADKELKLTRTRIGEIQGLQEQRINNVEKRLESLTATYAGSSRVTDTPRESTRISMGDTLETPRESKNVSTPQFVIIRGNEEKPLKFSGIGAHSPIEFLREVKDYLKETKVSKEREISHWTSVGRTGTVMVSCIQIYNAGL